MQTTFLKRFTRHTIWLSLLIHLLFLLLFTSVMYHANEQDKAPGLVISSYTAPEATPAAPQASPSPVKQPVEKEQIQKSNEGLEKPKPIKTVTTQPSKPTKPQVKHQNQFKAMSPVTDSEPVHLIGDKNISDPLAVLLGKAITAKLIYPRIAVDFQLKGTVLVGFTLHPSGQLTDIRLVRTSNTGVLDQAALDAFNAISPVDRVYKYVPEPRYLVIGIVFR